MSMFDVYKEKVIDKVCIVPKMMDHSYGLSFMSNELEKINTFISFFIGIKDIFGIKYFFQSMNKQKEPYYVFIEIWNENFEDQLFEIADKISVFMKTTVEMED